MFTNCLYINKICNFFIDALKIMSICGKITKNTQQDLTGKKV